MVEIILASKSKVREEILKKNGIQCIVFPSNIDEDPVKESLLNEGASPEIISIFYSQSVFLIRNTGGGGFR